MEWFDILYKPNFMLRTLTIFIGLYLYGRTFGFFINLGIKGPKLTAYDGNMIEMGRKRIFFPVNEYSENMLMMAKDDHWKYLRTVLAPSYSSKRMREMVPLIEDVLKTFEKNLNKIADSKEATDVTILFSGYTMNVIASTGFGIEVDSQENPNSPLVKNAQKVFEVDVLKSIQALAGLSDVEVIAQCMIFFLAGFDTTVTTLSFFAHSIAMNPDVQEKICQEIEEKLGQESPNYDNVQKLTYLQMCMEETLRMYPVAAMLIRKSKEDCIVKGMKIPQNTGVMFPIMCLHYDPRYWTELEKFDPEHFSEENKAKQIPFTYLPFGGGPRICAGMRLAELEFKMAAVQMLRKFRLVCDKTEKKIEFSKTGHLKPKNGICVKIEHHQQSNDNAAQVN